MKSASDAPADLFESGLSTLEIDVSPVARDAIIRYLQLLDKWNSAYNLSGIKDIQKMVGYHLLDSLAVMPYINGDTILDVGTGAGLPGIPLSIVYPDKKFHLLDSNGKKTRFLFQVKTELGLDNVEIHHARIESFQSPDQIDIVICRAFAPLERITRQISHILKDGGCLLAMKGQFPEAEIAELPDEYRVENTVQLPVPGVDGTRHLLTVRPAGNR